MEYIVSARKYRPSSFDAVVGQQALTTTLKNAVVTGKLAHAYLFCGPRGVGKTTCARIFAKVINCTNPKSDGDACGECESCKAFAEQRSLNIFELDAASNNGVEHIKSLMDQTRVPPQVGKYKVFIIDEVHMLSAAAFNAFLKTLEEPPAHVVFILATTEKHKILPTILSRCQVYDFERMSVPNIINHLKRVADDQGVTYDEQALNLIAEKADGGMRDALSIFDQAASFCQGNITYEKVLEDLNVLDVDNYFKAIDLALECKVTEEMLLLNSVMEKGFDGGHFVNGLATHVRNVLMAADESTLKLIETSDALRARYAEQAKKCPAKFLYSALRILNDCDVKYRQSSNKRLLVELSLIEVAQIQQQDEDGVGRGPKTKLKSLFKNIMAEIQSRPASQGAGTGRTVLSGTGQQNQGANAVSGNIQSSSPVTPPPAPKISISGVGMSFASIVNGPKGETKTEVLDKKTTETNDFTLNDLRMQWLAMCNRMEATKMGGMAKRLKNIVPSITVYPNIELVVENEMFKNELIEIKKRLEVTMSKYLRNGNLTLSIRLAEQAEKRKILTPKENFEEMLEYSEALKFLAEKLQLELE
ncbi:MAG: DNA polymerase III subunit gamma/tau [Prevotellaceae bacterium]|nr:DNA polymerase III subunit gamma/tau [Prevotellaceae bacterium]